MATEGTRYEATVRVALDYGWTRDEVNTAYWRHEQSLVKK